MTEPEAKSSRIASPKRKGSPLKDTILVAVSILVCTFFAELVVRVIDDQPLFAFPLPQAQGVSAVSDALLDRVPRASGVERAWFFQDPAPLPNRKEPPAGWRKIERDLSNDRAGGMLFTPSDAFKVWNSAVVAGDPCRHPALKFAPGQLWTYDPPDKGREPPYRFYPDVTLPDGLVTNQIGWRGRPIQVPRGDRTIRIVFVGSSTVVDYHHLPYSFPEYVGAWLERWAAARHPGVKIEVLNSARESNVSADLAAIVHNEILPLQPDLVVYSEGGNEFRPASIVDRVPEGKPVVPAGAQPNVAPDWLRAAARYSALLGRVQSAIGLVGSDLDGREWPKPDYKVVWPEGLDENDPALDYPKLPINLNTIVGNIDRIRNDVASVNGELAIASFLWMVKDGLVLDPVRHRYILEQLNVINYPYRYRDLERLARFQNRYFAKYARTHNLPFVDVAANMPMDPDLFADAVHSNNAGIRMKGWATLQHLVPLIDKRIADGTWPRKRTGAEPPLPTFTPRQISFKCSK